MVFVDVAACDNQRVFRERCPRNVHATRGAATAFAVAKTRKFDWPGYAEGHVTAKAAPGIDHEVAPGCPALIHQRKNGDFVGCLFSVCISFARTARWNPEPATHHKRCERGVANRKHPGGCLIVQDCLQPVCNKRAGIHRLSSPRSQRHLERR